jgi:hypothetical protein
MVALRVSGDFAGPSRVLSALPQLLSRAIGDLLKVGVDSARAGMPKDIGTGRTSIVSAQRGLMGVVSSPLAHVSIMDQGRRPGAKPPPTTALAGWASRHGFRGSLFVLARSIGRKGIKGKFFYQKAADKMISAIPAGLAGISVKVQGAWAARS